MTTVPYEHVQPHDHGGTCRRGQDPAGPHYGLDRENCERCRNLWARLDEVAARRKEGRR